MKLVILFLSLSLTSWGAPEPQEIQGAYLDQSALSVKEAVKVPYSQDRGTVLVSVFLGFRNCGQKLKDGNIKVLKTAEYSYELSLNHNFGDVGICMETKETRYKISLGVMPEDSDLVVKVNGVWLEVHKQGK